MSTLLSLTQFKCLYITQSVLFLFKYFLACNHSKRKCQHELCLGSVRTEVIFGSHSPNQWQSVSSPQYRSSAASYIITLLQQLCCVSHFAAVCTTFTLHCAVSLLAGNFLLIGLSWSHCQVVCCSSLLLPSKCYYFDYYSVTRLRPFDPSRLPVTFHLATLCLVFLLAVTDGDPQYVKPNGLTNTRCCRYNCVCSWWWVEIPPETCRAVSRYK